jgi:monothiol glutaredoxin
VGILDRVRRKLRVIGPGSEGQPVSVAPPLPAVELDPEPESPRGDEPAQAYIARMVGEHPVMLFMKGSPDQPRCGFSANATAILGSYPVEVAWFDVLLDDEVRFGIKEYSSWPTIPQLFVAGELVGGSDILTQLHESGELAEMLAATRPSD